MTKNTLFYIVEDDRAHNRKTPMGGLMADQPFGPESVQLTCTIDGTYAAHENEYREP
ncbi:hypothetical protein C667_02223 [Thauera phenylacetica B4P]|uniref:Uncharacterized protein n=1 Tax=Thauera phenylacetica B4P TaxID=1234382 RepID=N6ZW37_9RHOO|nr:hypothetical protein [Thauera phenylacetica]ENO98702.1 hypothetical protein C667_02223 [Thauera phenylacetica B4P]